MLYSPAFAHVRVGAHFLHPLSPLSLIPT